jgi:DtxR family Mn-dependent transcriptional regulator
VTTITPAMEDYLKVIYAIEESGDRVATHTVAERLNVAAPSVTGMLKRLAELNLVEHEPYRAPKLTPAGRKVALEVVRHHRLLELYLAEALGYSWDEVHAEADRLEHTISEEFEARIDAALGFPTHDPHGDPIPSRTGDIVAVSEDRLSTLETGCAATVVRVPDDDPEKLRYLGQLGLYPNATIRVLERMPFNGPLRIEVDGDEHIIAVDLAAGVHVRAAAYERE